MDSWERIEWPLTFGMALISFALGLVGYSQLLHGSSLADGNWSWTDVLYGTLRLFVLDADADGGSASWPVALQVARLLAPFSLAWAAIRGFLVVARDSIQERRVARQLQRMEGHTVLLGGGATGAVLWKRLVERGDDVVRALCDDKVEVGSDGESWCHTEGANEREGIRASRVEAAGRVVVASGSDHQNMRIVEELIDYLGSERSPASRNPIACSVEMSVNPGSPLRRGDAARSLSGKGLLAVRLFQPDRIAARVLIGKCPPHSARLPGPDERPIHVLVQGFGSFGIEAVKQLIRVGHYRDRNRIQLTIVAEEAQRAWKRFQKEVPALEDVADVVFRSGDPGAITDAEWQEMQSRGDFDAVYCTAVDDDEALAFAMDAKFRLGGAGNHAKVTVCGGGASLVVVRGSESTQIQVFDPQELAWTVGYLLEDLAEDAAMAIHERYYKGRKSEPDFGERPADRPWWHLLEHLRDNNRDQADHIDVKLDMLGMSRAELIELATKSDHSGGESVLRLDEVELERMAEVEHRRWWASRALAGYTHGDERDEELRRHPNMVSYSDLDERARQYDRDVIAGLPETLRVLEGEAGLRGSRSEGGA